MPRTPTPPLVRSLPGGGEEGVVGPRPMTPVMDREREGVAVAVGTGEADGVGVVELPGADSIVAERVTAIDDPGKILSGGKKMNSFSVDGLSTVALPPVAVSVNEEKTADSLTSRRIVLTLSVEAVVFRITNSPPSTESPPTP